MYDSTDREIHRGMEVAYFDTYYKGVLPAKVIDFTKKRITIINEVHRTFDTDSRRVLIINK